MALSECVPASVWCPVVLVHFCVWYVLVFYAPVYMHELYIPDLRCAGVMQREWLLFIQISR